MTQEYSYLPTISALFYEPNRTYSSFIVQLEGVMIKVPTLQTLRLRANPR